MQFIDKTTVTVAALTFMKTQHTIRILPVAKQTISNYIEIYLVYYKYFHTTRGCMLFILYINFNVATLSYNHNKD